ncbi:branched-chain amino acid ABC transporter permease [Haloarchaeobius amylolyticus]|uniref:branched-chain amino acid ABC transporter permease n=1 Tax=Haloarchaeobius amylolyticus TaxID=1198296 RepID=UPI003F63925A
MIPLVSLVDAILHFADLGVLVGIVLDGLAKASLYIMIAAGLTLIFGLMGVLNFAHGSLTTIGAYLGGLLMVTLVSQASGDVARLAIFFVAVVVVFALLTGFGSLLEVKLIRPLYDRPPLYQILLTFGVTLVLEELLRMILLFYGVQPSTKWQEALGTKPALLSPETSFMVLGARVEGLELFEIVFGAVVVAALWAFLTQTRYGLYIRAGSEDTEMAEALGINVRQAFTVVFGIGVGVTGIAGTLLMWDVAWAASISLGAEVLLPAFVVVIVGGLGTFRGTVVAGVLVGFVDAFTTELFTSNIVSFTALPELIIFLILVVMLVVKPQGLYGVEEVGGH